MDLFGDEPAEEEFEASSIPPAPLVQEEEGLVHPRLMSFCLGHDKIEQELLKLLEQGKCPHALIFSGIKGIGKSTFAYRLARHVLKTEKEDAGQGGMFDDLPAESPSSMDMDVNDPVFRLVASGAHPDLLGLERAVDEGKGTQKNSLDVEQLRKVAPFLRKTASYGGWRVVVIDDADTMNRNAQNALLKILEEPPSDTLLILVTHRIGALIPTIRSRSRVVDFSPLSQENIQTLMQRRGERITEQEITRLLHLSGGSIGKALQFLDEGGLEILERILMIFQQYPDWKQTDLHAMADEFARLDRGKSYESFAGLMLWLADELARAKARGQEQAAEPLNLEVFGRILKNSSLESLIKICENLGEHFDQVSRASLDKRHGVMEAFSLMRAA